MRTVTVTLDLKYRTKMTMQELTSMNDDELESLYALHYPKSKTVCDMDFSNHKPKPWGAGDHVPDVSESNYESKYVKGVRPYYEWTPFK